MNLHERMQKLEKAAEPLIEAERRKIEQVQADEEVFQGINQILKSAYPEHQWNNLNERDKRHLAESENKLYTEARQLTIEFLRVVERAETEGLSDEEFANTWPHQKETILKKLEIEEQCLDAFVKALNESLNTCQYISSAEKTKLTR